MTAYIKDTALYCFTPMFTVYPNVFEHSNVCFCIIVCIVTAQSRYFAEGATPIGTLLPPVLKVFLAAGVLELLQQGDEVIIADHGFLFSVRIHDTAEPDHDWLSMFGEHFLKHYAYPGITTKNNVQPAHPQHHLAGLVMTTVATSHILHTHTHTNI